MFSRSIAEHVIRIVQLCYSGVLSEKNKWKVPLLVILSTTDIKLTLKFFLYRMCCAVSKI